MVEKNPKAIVSFIIAIIIVSILFPIGLSSFLANPLRNYRQTTIYLTAPDNPMLFYMDNSDLNYTDIFGGLELENVPAKNGTEFNRTIVFLIENNTETNLTMDMQYLSQNITNIAFGFNISFNVAPTINLTFNITIHFNNNTEMNLNFSLFMITQYYDTIMVQIDAIWVLIPLFVAIGIILKIYYGGKYD